MALANIGVVLRMDRLKDFQTTLRLDADRLGLLGARPRICNRTLGEPGLVHLDGCSCCRVPLRA